MEDPQSNPDLDYPLAHPNVSRDGRWVRVAIAWGDRVQSTPFPPVCIRCLAPTAPQFIFPLDRYKGIRVAMCEACELAYRRRFERLMVCCALPFLALAIVVGWLLWEPDTRLGKQVGLLVGSGVAAVGTLGSGFFAKWLAAPIKTNPMAMFSGGLGGVWVRFENEAFVQAYVDYHQLEQRATSCSDVATVAEEADAVVPSYRSQCRGDRLQ